MEFLIKLGVFLVLVAIGYWRGRRNERAHLQSLDAEEDALTDILIFATRYPPASAEVLDPVLVSGSAVVGSDYFRLFVAGLRKIVGGNYRAYEQLMERGRRQALVRLKQAAKAKGAKMVFNVRLTTSRISNSRGGEATQVEVLAYGTAFVRARGTVAESRVTYVPGPPLPNTEAFNLLTHRFTRWGLFVSVGALVYVFVEMLSDQAMTHQWRYAFGAPWLVFTGIAVFASSVAAWCAVRAKAPLLTCIVLALFATPGLIGAQYFAALRLNSLLSHGPQSVPYRVDAKGQLEPLVADYPVLHFENYEAYWHAQTPGAPATFTLLRGALGFYQYDLRPLGPAYSHFYNPPTPARKTMP